jgi:hypothetical protein
MKDYFYRGYHVIEKLSGGFTIVRDGTTIAHHCITSRVAEEVIDELVDPPTTLIHIERPVPA